MDINNTIEQIARKLFDLYAADLGYADTTWDQIPSQRAWLDDAEQVLAVVGQPKSLKCIILKHEK